MFFERLQHAPQRRPAWRRCGAAPRAADRPWCASQKTTAIDGERDRPDLRDRLPAVGDHDEGRDELGDGGADVAGAEDAERGALLAPSDTSLRDVGDADRERAAGDADAERREQERRVVVGEGEKPGCDRRRQHHRRIDDAAAVLVGPDAEHQADQRAGQDRRADQQAELGLGEPEVLLDLNADDRKDRPDGEADGEGNGGEPERPSLVAFSDCRRVAHELLPRPGLPAVPGGAK